MTLAKGQIPLAKPNAFESMICVCGSTRAEHRLVGERGPVTHVDRDHAFTPEPIVERESVASVEPIKIVLRLPEPGGQCGFLAAIDEAQFRAKLLDEKVAAARAAFPDPDPDPTDARRAEMVAEDQPERAAWNPRGRGRI